MTRIPVAVAVCSLAILPSADCFRLISSSRGKLIFKIMASISCRLMVFFWYEASSVCETKKNISLTQKFIFRLQNIFLASQKKNQQKGDVARHV
jgi:hypothetical protein